MRPEVLRDGLGGDWMVVGCEETTQYFFKGINASFAAPDINKSNGKEVGCVSVNLVRTIVPDTGDERVGFVQSSRDRGNGVVGMDEGVDDEMESNNDNV